VQQPFGLPAALIRIDESRLIRLHEPHSSSCGFRCLQQRPRIDSLTRCGWQTRRPEMVIYEYRCAQHGEFEVLLPMGSATSTVPCPQCGSNALRALSAPSVARASRSAWFGAIEHAEKSRHEPEVVSAVPSAGARRRQVSMTPALRRLPRP
jgi:putative FmdB family regulatory protein